MERYRNLSGTSGVVAYRIDDAGILVQFHDGKKYLYTEASAGSAHLAQLKRLAVAGRGLNTYISSHCWSSYAWSGR